MSEHEKRTRHDEVHDVAPPAPEHAGTHASVHARAGEDAAHRMAKHGIQDLGTLAHPGQALKGLHHLQPGQSLRFSVAVNQIWGLGEINLSPAGAGLELQQKEVHAMQPGVLGSTSLQQYTLTMTQTAKAGTKFTVTTLGNYQVRDNPDWAFSFTVVSG
jgi:hypothetical protein